MSDEQEHRPITTSMDHPMREGRWAVVSTSETHVTVSAMCECGDDNCYFVANVYKNDFVHITPARLDRR